jgi:ABC-type multidrug transport system fused ATPase/permease subunit
MVNHSCTNHNLFIRLWCKINLKRRAQIAILFFLMIISSIAEVVSIGAIFPFLGALTSSQTSELRIFGIDFFKIIDVSWQGETRLLLISIIFACATVVAGLMRLGLMWYQTRLSYSMGAEFSVDIYARTLYQPYLTHTMRNSSELISGITNKTNAIINNAIYPILSLASSAVLFITVITALILFEPYIALSTIIGFFIIYSIVIGITKKYLLANGKKVDRMQPRVIKAIQEGLGGIRDILIDGSQLMYSKIYQEAEIPLRRSLANIQIISSTPRFIIESLGMTLIITVACISTYRDSSASELIPALGVLALGAQRMLPIAQQAYAAWAAVQSGRASLESAMDLLDQPLPSSMTIVPTKKIAFNKEIVLSNISFAYPGKSDLALHDVNFRIPKGSKIGIIGVTGSGKSTLLDILMGLLPVKTGSMLVDGVPIGDDNFWSWQSHIAHVPQSIFLADISVAENIAFGVPIDQINYDQVRYAAQLANLSNTIESWDDKYMTPVGERGVRLSGGQRQRIGIARALYRKADVIVFDEATSALDTKTEESIMDEINCMDRNVTMIMVAHRISTLKQCDQIIEIAGNTIARVINRSESFS